jgi:hypothetical protein
MRHPVGIVERSTASLAFDGSLAEIVEAVRAIPYGRPSDRSVEGMLRERRGTCSTKHLFLARVLAERFPASEPRIVHRVYRLERALAEQLFGAEVAGTIPPAGLVDVHRYLRITVDGRMITIDATFPGERWDGRSSLALACGPGEDLPAGDSPDQEKRALEARYCDAATREAFIAALAARSARAAVGGESDRRASATGGNGRRSEPHERPHGPVEL